MLTKKGYENLLSRIAATGGFTEDMQEDLRRLKSEFDEREGILRKYGESYDGETEEYEWKERPSPNYEADLRELQSRYDTLVERYNQRYFSGGDERRTDHEENYVSSEKEDETKEITVKDLFIEIP